MYATLLRRSPPPLPLHISPAFTCDYYNIVLSPRLHIIPRAPYALYTALYDYYNIIARLRIINIIIIIIIIIMVMRGWQVERYNIFLTTAADQSYVLIL